MPTYVYKFVKTGETIEVQQSFADDALTQAVNPRTGRKMAVKKVFTPVGVTFRGDGFYKTDSRSSSKKSSGSTTNGDASSNGGSSSNGDSGSTKSESTSDSGSAKKTESKPTTSSATSSD